MSEASKHTSFSSGILSFLPMFYVAWSDSVLSPSEMKLIHRQIESLDFLSQDNKDYLIRWTDPAHPPDDHIFKEWMLLLKSHSKKLNFEKKKSLVDLGIEMALATSLPESKGIWKSAKIRYALVQIAEALGVQGTHSFNLFLSKFEPDKLENYEEYSFVVKKMKLFLDGEEVELKDRIRRLMSDPVFAGKEHEDKDLFRLAILKLLKSLAKQGIGAYAFPKKYGGFERGDDHMVVFEMMSYGNLSLLVKFGVQFGLFGGAIYQLGTEKHHKRYLEALSRAELLGCYAMTETGHGSNVKGLETTATYKVENDCFIIHSPNYNSRKEFIGNAMHCSMAVVFAQLHINGESQGVHAFLVKIRDRMGDLMPGINIADNGYKMGLNGVDNGKIWFDKVVIPKDNLLDRFGRIDSSGSYSSPIKNPSKRFFTMLGALVVGRISIGLASVSVSKSALTIGIRYALRRKQFSLTFSGDETLLLDYPSHQARLLPLLAKTYAYDFALKELRKSYFNEISDNKREIETLAAGLKAKASWHCTNVVQECREACGGKGYLKENRIPDLKADSDIFTTFEGDNTVLMQLVAKSLLTEFRQSFHDGGYRAIIIHLYKRFSHRMLELNPIFARNTSSAHLLDREFHLEAFEYRKEKTLISLGLRMRNYLRKRIDPAQAFLKCQIHMISVSHAYIDWVVLKSFVKTIENCNDHSLKPILNSLCDLYALTVVNEERAWFLENHYFDGSKTKAIRRVLEKLYGNLRSDAGALVNAFGIPDEVLNAKFIT